MYPFPFLPISHLSSSFLSIFTLITNLFINIIILVKAHLALIVDICSIINFILTDKTLYTLPFALLMLSP